MFQKFLRIIFIFVFIFHIGLISYAQRNTDIQIFTQIQDPKTKEFKIIVNILSETASDRVTIKFDLPAYIQSNSASTQNISLQKGENIFLIDAVPISPGTGTLDVVVQNFSSDRSFLTTQSAELNITSNLDLRPVSQEYLTLLNLNNIKDSLNNVIIIMGALFILFAIFTKISKKINPTKPVPETPRDSRILEEFARQKSQN